MVRTMVYLPEPLYRGLKHLAIERHTSLTGLIRDGLEALYREDLEDLRIGQKRLEEHLARPERSRKRILRAALKAVNRRHGKTLRALAR